VDSLLIKIISKFSGTPARAVEALRPSSAPFISGDTFREMADFVIENFPGFKEIATLPKAKSSQIIFVKVDVFKPSRKNNHFLEWLTAGGFLVGQGPQVLIHNGDLPPSDEFIDELVAAGARVYCVNKVKSSLHVTPIPIGLENLHHGVNGVLENFSPASPDRASNDELLSTKNIEVFSSFNVSTNPKIRSALVEKIAHSRHYFIGSGLTPDEFRSKVSRSLFVLSPAGNGLDCHRTWESIYLDSLPVVMKGSLAASLTAQLPIWEVSDWDEVLLASPKKLLEKFAALRSRSLSLAYSPYWQDLTSRRRTTFDYEA
jgi:hypothetical protein